MAGGLQGQQALQQARQAWQGAATRNTRARWHRRARGWGGAPMTPCVSRSFSSTTSLPRGSSASCAAAGHRRRG
jgi:hypothetical protein